METKKVITIETTVNMPAATVWQKWTEPAHVMKWNNATDDWYTPKAENDFREGGKFSTRMEAKDGSMGFDFAGVNDIIREHEYIEYTIGDGRKVKVSFTPDGNSTKISESFEAESQNPPEMQQAGWQAILDNFKKYAENS